MTVLVTGATGLLGNNVVRLLIDRNEAVRVLVRASSDPRPLQGLDVETMHGDLRDAAAVLRACRGASAVIHCGAFVHIGWSQSELHRAINVEGTRNAAAAAAECGARLVHVSSVDALGVGRRDQPADEGSVDPAITPCPYTISKRQAEQAVIEQIAAGLDAVIVNPGYMLGPWDWKPSSGMMLIKVAKRFTPVSPSGGTTVCDARDVAAGALAALESGAAGRNYILAGENMPYLQVWRMFAAVSHSSPPRFRAGPIVRVIGGRFGDLWSRVSSAEAEVNSAAVRLSSEYHYFDCARAKRELGYQSRPVRETVEDTWRWFQEHGYV